MREHPLGPESRPRRTPAVAPAWLPFVAAAAGPSGIGGPPAKKPHPWPAAESPGSARSASAARRGKGHPGVESAAESAAEPAKMVPGGSDRRGWGHPLGPPGLGGAIAGFPGHFASIA